MFIKIRYSNVMKFTRFHSPGEASFKAFTRTFQCVVVGTFENVAFVPVCATSSLAHTLAHIMQVLRDTGFCKQLGFSIEIKNNRNYCLHKCRFVKYRKHVSTIKNVYQRHTNTLHSVGKSYWPLYFLFMSLFRHVQSFHFPAHRGRLP